MPRAEGSRPAAPTPAARAIMSSVSTVIIVEATRLAEVCLPARAGAGDRARAQPLAPGPCRSMVGRRGGRPLSSRRYLLSKPRLGCRLPAQGEGPQASLAGFQRTRGNGLLTGSIAPRRRLESRQKRWGVPRRNPAPQPPGGEQPHHPHPHPRPGHPATAVRPTGGGWGSPRTRIPRTQRDRLSVGLAAVHGFLSLLRDGEYHKPNSARLNGG
jgi:hypothetical protein